MMTATKRLRTTHLSSFRYRGCECEVHRVKTALTPWVNGYINGNISVFGYDDASEKADVHGGFTFYEQEPDGTVTLGFDTAHYFDGPHTQNETFVTAEIKRAVDNLIAARLVR